MAEVIPIKLFKTGSQGPEVAELQASLKRLGLYLGTLDGLFGAELENSVRAFQAAHSMPPDGIVDPGTVAAINRALSAQGQPATLAQLVSPDLAQQVRNASAPSTALAPSVPGTPAVQQPGVRAMLAQIPRNVYIVGGVLAAAGVAFLWYRSRETTPAGDFDDFEDEAGLADVDGEFEDPPARKKPTRKKNAKKAAASKKDKQKDPAEDDAPGDAPEDAGAAAEA